MGRLCPPTDERKWKRKVLRQFSLYSACLKPHVMHVVEDLLLLWRFVAVAWAPRWCLCRCSCNYRREQRGQYFTLCRCTWRGASSQLVSSLASHFPRLCDGICVGGAFLGIASVWLMSFRSDLIKNNPERCACSHASLSDANNLLSERCSTFFHHSAADHDIYDANWR